MPDAIEYSVCQLQTEGYVCRLYLKHLEQDKLISMYLTLDTPPELGALHFQSQEDQYDYKILEMILKYLEDHLERLHQGSEAAAPYAFLPLQNLFQFHAWQGSIFEGYLSFSLEVAINIGAWEQPHVYLGIDAGVDEAQVREFLDCCNNVLKSWGVK